MISGEVTKDNNYWLGHPDTCVFKNKIYVCYRKSFQHLSEKNTEICVTHSDLSNINFNNSYISFSVEGRLDCPRLYSEDGVMYLICDMIPSSGDFISSENGPNTRICLWKTDNGILWDGPIITNIYGIVPSKPVKNKNGKYLIASHTKKYFLKKDNSIININNKKDFSSLYAKEEISGYLIQNLWISDSLFSNKWVGPIRVADKRNFNFCEASLFCIDQNIIGCMMRENSRRGEPSFYCLSNDGGMSWSELYKTRMYGCHRPVVGQLRSGSWLTTYREQKYSTNKKYWAKNTIACLSEKDDWNPKNSFVHSISLNIDHDRNRSNPDSGYTGWVQLNDDKIFIVNYITDCYDRPYIKYYLIEENDF